MAVPSIPTAPFYEIVPRDELPLLDLSRSVGGELLALLHRITRWRSSRVVDIGSRNAMADMLQVADTPLERLKIYRATLYAFTVGVLFGAVACVIPAAGGAVCAVIGLALVLPFTLASFVLLRYDMVALLVTTYDFWFYSFVNTVGAMLLSASFRDARACVAAIVWLGNAHSVLVDANTRLVCYLNVVSLAVVALSVVVMVAIETKAIDAWHPRHLRLRTGHDDLIGTDNLISNALTTMAIIVLRNAYRRHTELIQQAKIACPMLRCLNYRCRLAIRSVDSKRLAEIRAFDDREKIYYAPDCSKKFPLAQIHYLRFQVVLDASQTFFPVVLEPLVWSIQRRIAFVALGVTGWTCTAATFGLYPSPAAKPVAIVGLCFTMLYVGVAVALYQRLGTRAIVSSFDFVFLSIQLSSGLWATATLFNWDVRAIAVGSIWLWLHWVITVEAWTPTIRHKIGVDIRLLVVPVLLLFVAAQLCMALELFWRDRWMLSDRVLVSLFGRVDLRLLPFFLSRLTMISLWSLRLMWRVMRSSDGDAIIQIGRVAFRYTDTISQPSSVVSKVAKAAATMFKPKRMSISKTLPPHAAIKPATISTESPPSHISPVTTFNAS